MRRRHAHSEIVVNGNPASRDTRRLERAIRAHLAEAAGIEQERRYWEVVEALRASSELRTKVLGWERPPGRATPTEG